MGLIKIWYKLRGICNRKDEKLKYFNENENWEDKRPKNFCQLINKTNTVKNKYLDIKSIVHCILFNGIIYRNIIAELCLFKRIYSNI